MSEIVTGIEPIVESAAPKHRGAGRQPVSRKRRWPRIALLLLAGWACLELIALGVFHFGGAKAFDPVPLLYKPHPYRVYALIPGAKTSRGHVSVNSLGFRGPEFDKRKTSDTLRIVCLGGSTTYSDAASSDAFTWPARLESRLRELFYDQTGAIRRIEVINAGVPGYTSLESLIHFETRLLDYKPDVAIFHHGLDDAVFMACFRDFVSDYTHARKVMRLPAPRPWERSALLSLAFPAHRSPTNPFRGGTLAQLTLTDPGRLYASEAEQRRCFDPKRLEIFARNLRNFIYVARAHGVAPVLSTVVCSREAGFFAEVVEQANARIRQTAESLSAPCIDVARELPWDKKYFVDQCLPNEEGLAREAEIAARHLIDGKIVGQALRPAAEAVGR